MKRIAMAVAAVAAVGASARSAAAETRVYRLGAGSSYQQGCFDPCDCPLEGRRALGGTFRLTPLGAGAPVRGYRVWEVRIGGTEAGPRFVGWGTYVVDGTPVATHRMSLMLQDNESPLPAFFPFDGGPEPIADTGLFPGIAIEIDRNNRVCFDQVIGIGAGPMPAGDWNGDGAVRIEDVFAFLGDWFAGDGDYGGDGETGVGDVFEFLGDWFGG